MSRLRFPFGSTALGQSRAAAYGTPEHVRDCLELLIMTMPGERVMRPDFGSPVRQMLFGAGDGPAAIALEAALEAAISQWLGHLLTVEALDVAFDPAEAALTINITYEIRGTRQSGSLSLRKDLGGGR